jgi:hypothetical protein
MLNLKSVLSPTDITYAFIPKTVVNTLMSQLGLQDATLQLNRWLQPNDTVPADINITEIAQVGVWWNNGIGMSIEVS